ncbi:E3 ubiquitin-protein ligase ORTHRUS 2-like [Quillaja saponaria]|uniref:RING-type E3 ubiquitin transferase n=1 Tax=Quillaja saponaria TaxID=32244 RepID=A0AAD7LPS2_QUISA|nr:E3 ubiquitin-protein ligase ORTHRUS 2-like [Quillaja saponaria]
MAQNQLPCDGDGICMLCKAKPSDEEKLNCKTCATPWHAGCLSSRPDTLAATLEWDCPDCTSLFTDLPPVSYGKSLLDGAGDTSGDLIVAIRAIEADTSLTEREKAKKRQNVLSGKTASEEDADDAKMKKGNGGGKDVLDVLDGSLNCSFCMQLPERPVTTPCGHNFCLKCFQKWTGQGKRTCAKCRCNIPPKMASQPRINSALVIAIRMAKMSKNVVAGGPSKVYHVVHNQDRPDKAYTTERAQRKGNSNAASGKIFVTVPHDHFGPIPAEYDPSRNQGVLVGECWEDRLECRQWGAHFPHVSGIAGQSEHGAQSVVLSGGYIDDEDHGEWFLYTGSGGRDLSGNKRTNKEQSFDQTFEKSNKALKLSCLKGYPVRVVRSHKEKRSSYAPEKGLRYDGIYRIEKCWRKVGVQGFKVCRYLFVRCDNDPAPWTSDEIGDRPRLLPVISEFKKATEIIERKGSPSWDFDGEGSCWKWKKPPPASKKCIADGNPDDPKRSRKAIRKGHNTSVRDKLLKEFSCLTCRKVMVQPVTTPCAHNFCKLCLEGAYAGQTFVRDRSRGGRSLRSQKNVMKCPSCPFDISDFLQNLQVNRELMDVIESLKSKAEEYGDSAELAEEDVDGSEENSDVESEKDETNAEKDENLNEAMQDPPVKSISKSDNQCKVDGEESKISVQEHDVSNGNSENGKHQSGDLEGANEAVPAVKRPTKRKKPNAEGHSPKGGVGKKTRRGKEAHEPVDGGNNSPSSPLHVLSDNDFV